MFALFVALMIPLFITGFRRKLHLGAFIVFGFPFVAYALVHGEWLGLPVADTDQWGGFMLTFFLASVGIVGALPLGILFALGRRSKMPVIRSFSVFYIEMWRAAPLITVLYMASNLLPLFFPSEVDFDKVVRATKSAYTARRGIIWNAARCATAKIPSGNPRQIAGRCVCLVGIRQRLNKAMLPMPSKHSSATTEIRKTKRPSATCGENTPLGYDTSASAQQ